MPPPAAFAIRPIRADDKFGLFSLGDAAHQPLKTFLRKKACDYEQCCVARTHVLVDAEKVGAGARVWGYITLVVSEVVAEANAQPPTKEPWPYRVPAVKIARMAIDRELQSKKWGRALLSFAIALIKDNVSIHVGCRLVITDAKLSATGFYERAGFSYLDTPDNKTRPQPVMFMKLDKLAP